MATPQQDDTDNILCMDHVTKMSRLYCKTCHVVCPDRLSPGHSNHPIVPIGSALEDKLGQLKDLSEKIDNDLNFCEIKYKEIEIATVNYDSIADDSLTKIKQREQELKDAVSEYSKSLQDQVEDERSKFKDIASKIKHDIDEAKKKLSVQRNELEAALTSNQEESLCQINMEAVHMNLNSLYNDIGYFHPSTETTKTILKLFGTLQKLKLNMEKPEIDLDILKTLTTGSSSVDQIKASSEKTAYILQSSLLSNKTIRNGCVIDNRLYGGILAGFSGLSEDMALTSNKDILLTDKSEVNLLTRSGEIKSYIKLSHWSPKSIHVSNVNDVLVGVTEYYSMDLSPEKCQGAVIVFGEDCIQKNIFIHDGNKKRIFTFPKRIRTNINKDIIVIDKTSGNTGRLVVLDKEGDLRWVYEGAFQINAAKNFYPTAIATTSEGHIIVTDIATDAIHEISQDGGLISYRVLDTIGIQYPLAIDFDQTGQLWIGCGMGGKLHIVKLHKH